MKLTEAEVRAMRDRVLKAKIDDASWQISKHFWMEPWVIEKMQRVDFPAAKLKPPA